MPTPILASNRSFEFVLTTVNEEKQLTIPMPTTPTMATIRIVFSAFDPGDPGVRKSKVLYAFARGAQGVEFRVKETASEENSTGAGADWESSLDDISGLLKVSVKSSDRTAQWNVYVDVSMVQA